MHIHQTGNSRFYQTGNSISMGFNLNKISIALATHTAAIYAVWTIMIPGIASVTKLYHKLIPHIIMRGRAGETL